MRWTIEIPLDSIERIGEGEAKAPPKNMPGYLKAVLLGGANCRIELNREAEALGVYGFRRDVTIIDTQLDQPERFVEAVLAARREPRPDS